jgi:SSS family solute:Na+ symporter
MYAGLGLPQLFYLAAVFVPAVPDTYLGWPAAVVGMALGLVLTVGVSAVTTQDTDEETAVVFEGARAD